jgi:hypothetical protein
LRPAQHFDALQIEQVENRAGGPAEYDVIDIDRDSLLRGRFEIAVTETADGRRERRAPTGTELVDDDVRGPIGDVDDAGGAVVCQCLAGDGGDRERRLLQRLLAESGRDDDFFEFAAGLLRLRKCEVRA